MKKEKMIEDLQRQLHMQNILIECIYTLHAGQNMEVAMREMLAIIAHYYQADRTYVFQFDSGRKWMDNTYEWCREGVPPEKDRLQHLKVSAIERWFPWSENSGEFPVSCRQEELDKKSKRCGILDSQDLSKHMTAPLFFEGSLMGFLGVDNPDTNADAIFLLQSAARFLVHDLFFTH